MVLKIIRSVWFLSVVAVLGTLLFVYASLPEEVIIQEKDLTTLSVSRDILFYTVLVAIIFVNVLVYIIAALFPQQEDFRAWFHGLMVTVNTFFIIALLLVNVYNSNEKFAYEDIGFLIYGSLSLIVVWAGLWPVYTVFQKKSINHTV